MLAPVLRRPLQPMTIEEVELLAPRGGEVRIKMVASGVCHSCLHVIDGSYTGAPLPIVLGDEGAGIVTEIGSGVVNVAVGDHVIISWAPTCGYCHNCVRGRIVLCDNQPPFGYLGDGTTRFKLDGSDVYHYGPATYASEVVIPSSMAIPIRKDMPLEKAALIGCSVMTGVGAVTYTARVPAGASLAVFGCGGVGLNAVQGGALVSANPIIAVDISDSKLEHARVMGATHTINSAKTADVPEAIRALTGGRGTEFAVIAVGNGKVVQQAWDGLAKGGTAVMVGLMPSGELLSIEPIRLMGHECRLIGSRYGSAVPSDDFPRMVDLYMAGKLKIDQLITRRYGLDEINEAHRALAAGENARSIIVY
jgi:S-(hydroxymethyl)glutathione dehydrogenase/alcohol dehydrogenase